MTQLGNDTFTRANQSGWGTASDGQTWTATVGVPTLSIASNEGKLTGTTNQCNVILGSTAVADMEVLVRCSVSVAGFPGVVLRQTASNTNYRIRQNTATNTMAILRNVAGTTTSVATGSFTFSLNTFYWIRARIVGTQIDVRVWLTGTAEPTTWLASGTDSTITGAGKFGVFAFPNASTDIYQYDSFYAIDYEWIDSNIGSSSFAGTITTPGFVESDPASDSFAAVGSASFAEALSVTDATLFGGSFSTTDGVSGSSAYAATGGFIPVDQNTGSSSLLASDSALLIDQVIATDTSSFASSLLAVDQNTGLSLFTGNDGYIPVDSLSGSSSLLGTLGFLATDNASGSSSLFASIAVSWLDLLIASSRLSGNVGALFTDPLTGLSSFLASDVANWQELYTVLTIFSLTQQHIIVVVTEFTLVTAYGRDGHVQAHGRDGLVEGSMRDGRVQAHGRDGHVQAYGRDGLIAGRGH
jgi:hypothetical protein